MKGRYSVRFVLIALAAINVTAGRLAAGDLYNKEPLSMEAVILPKPAEIQTLSLYPGKVTLKGFVSNAMDKQLAGMAANRVFGVFSLNNELQIG